MQQYSSGGTSNFYNENLDLKVQLDEIRNELEDNRKCLHNANQVIKQMQETSASREINTHAAEISLQKEKIKNLSNLLSSKENMLRETSKELESYKSEHSTFADLQRRVKELTLENTLAKDAKNKAEHRNKLLTDQNNRYEENSLQETQTRVAALLRQIDDQDIEINKLKSEESKRNKQWTSKFTDLQYEYDELSRKYTTNKNNHETKEQAYRSEIEKLEYQLGKENRLRQALEQTAGSERQQTTAKDNVIESLTHSLQKSKDDNLYLNEKITLLETEKGKLADRINLFNKRSQNSDALVVKDLREKLAIADGKAHALAIQVSEKDILEERLARLTNQFERKARELGDLQRKYNTLLQNSDFDDSSRIRQLEHEISRLQVEIDGKDELIKDLKKPLTSRNTTPKRASFHARRSDQSSEPSPIVKKENELLKVQLRRSRDMIKKMKLNCQELIDFVQMILNVRLNERDDIFAEEQWERRLRDLKDVINQKTPMQSPSRHEMSFLGSRDGLNMSGAKRQLLK